MIYAIAEDEHEGPVKIGYARGEPFIGDWKVPLLGRLRDAQLGNPRPLIVIALCSGRPQTERALHITFAKHRLFNEWFLREGKVLEFLDRFAILPIRNERIDGKRMKAPYLAPNGRTGPVLNRFLAASQRPRRPVKCFCSYCGWKGHNKTRCAKRMAEQALP